MPPLRAVNLTRYITILGLSTGVALEALSADEDSLLGQTRAKTDPDTPWRKSKLERRKRKVCALNTHNMSAILFNVPTYKARSCELLPMKILLWRIHMHVLFSRFVLSYEAGSDVSCDLMLMSKI